MRHMTRWLYWQPRRVAFAGAVFVAGYLAGRLMN